MKYYVYHSMCHIIDMSKSINYNAIVFVQIMSVERKKPLKREQALNDATSGQIGEEPRSVPEEQTSDLKNERMKTARKMSRDIQ
jgi:hypothetical protein